MNKYSESGQALILITFAIIGLVGFAALAIDGSRVLSDKRHAQNAADTAAYAAALASAQGKDINSSAQNRATTNGYDNGDTNDVNVTVTNTPSGVCPGSGKDITVTIISNVSTTFARVIGRQLVTNIVTAQARACDPVLTGGGPLYAGSAIYSTKTGSCNGANGSSLLVSGSGNLQIWGGDMGSASTDSDCISFNGGQTQLKKQESGSACADILTAAPSGGTFKNVSGQDGCGSIIYNGTFDAPPADLGITCNTNVTISGNTLNPGNFTGTFPGNGITTLNPGTYCVYGDFRLNGGQNLSGNGVTIVMNTGTLLWNGSSEVNLSAPTTGDYKGLLIYAPPTNSYANGNNQISIDGSGNAKITGTVLAQSLPCYFAGSGQIQKATLQFICYTWGMNGNGQGEIMYDSSKFYAPQTTILPTVALLQ